MSHTNSRGEAIPTVNVAINKSRLKSYSKDGKPTFYLKNGTEFQIEVFNPTSEMISARISLNGKRIGQGGLVLRPGERVFLDRYIDIPKKFRFETYEVNNTSEVRKAIESNGDLKVTFHKEYVEPNYNHFNYDLPLLNDWDYYKRNQPWTSPSTDPNPYTFFGATSVGASTSNLRGSDFLNSGTVGSAGTNSAGYCGSITNTLGMASMDSLGEMNLSASMGQDLKRSFVDTNASNPLRRLSVKKSKKVETGRVEEGSHSSQKFTQITKTFIEIPFQTYEFNLLPESTKAITTSELNKRRYCHNCGSKSKTNYKFCPNCGSKA